VTISQVPNALDQQSTVAGWRRHGVVQWLPSRSLATRWPHQPMDAPTERRWRGHAERSSRRDHCELLTLSTFVGAPVIVRRVAGL